MLQCACVFNNVDISTVIEMVEMVERLDERAAKRSVERVRYVINNLIHLFIVKYEVLSLLLCHTVATGEISHHLFHADPCNKSYM